MKHFCYLINCFTQKIFCIQNCTQIYRNITKYVTPLRSIFSVTQVLSVTSSLLYRNGWARPFKKGAINKNWKINLLTTVFAGQDTIWFYAIGNSTTLHRFAHSYFVSAHMTSCSTAPAQWVLRAPVSPYKRNKTRRYGTAEDHRLCEKMTIVSPKE